MSDPVIAPVQPPDTEPAPPTKPKILITIVRDGLEAEILLQRTSQNTSNPLLEDILAALAETGVTTGIKNDLIHTLCAEPIYNSALMIASGRKPTVGSDGELRYLIRTERVLKPALREDGTADYKDLGFINGVQEGQQLVEIIPPQMGEDGFDVLGNVLPGILGKPAPSPQGAGTQLSEDGSFLLAAVTGNADVKRGVVSVQDVLKVSNVDNSTGDIIFPGDVIVSGDIADGFRVISQNGNLLIKGTVGAATLEAAGNIVIGDGINGADRGMVSAGGNIKCRYLQNCYIRAEGNVYSDTIMYSTLECDGNVEMTGKRSQLVGGASYIAGVLTAKGIGTAAHTATKIRMCAASMAKKRELDELKQRIKQIDADITKIVQVLNRFEQLQQQNRLTPEHIQTIQSVKQNYVSLSGQRKEATEQIDLLEKEQLDTGAQHSFIKCTGRVHTGVSVSFGPLNMTVQESFVNSRISVTDGDIRVSPL